MWLRMDASLFGFIYSLKQTNKKKPATVLQSYFKDQEETHLLSECDDLLN